MIVEDDPSSGTALLYLLAREGWKATLTTSLADAMRLVKVDPPDSIVLDLMLPDGDGTAILEYVRANCPKIRVAVTTGVHDPQWLGRVQSLHPAIVLRKPVMVSELLKNL